MPIRDLGYKPYEGVRLPASNNVLVMLRHGLRRAWGSWLVKIALFTGWIPALVGIVIAGAVFWLSRNNPEVGSLDPVTFTRGLFGFQLWLFVTMITLGAGAGLIAEDATHRAFQFYFAKPVTPEQYFVGRTTAILFWCFVITFVPAVLLVLIFTGTAAEGERFDRLGLLFPSLLLSLLISLVCATTSVAVSALSRSRALTMSAWLLLFLVPEALAAIVSGIADWPWLKLLSLPSLMSVVGDALFKIQPATDMRWFHAAPVLAILVGGAIAFTLHRLRQVEVVT